MWQSATHLLRVDLERMEIATMGKRLGVGGDCSGRGGSLPVLRGRENDSGTTRRVCDCSIVDAEREKEKERRDDGNGSS